MMTLVLAIAEEDRVWTPGDDRGFKRSDACSMLDRKCGWRKVADAQAVGALDTVAETGHRSAVAAGRFATSTIVSAFL
jgi:hypothetical protein